jgi:hypothetical protein
MSKNHVHGREFLHLTATGASAATIAAFLASCQSRQFNTKVANTGAAGGKFRVRKKWGSADATKDMETYVKAVALLRANDAKAYQGGFYQPGAINAGFEVRQTWSGLAWIHFASCPHGNWYFVPWHRVYLNYFEAACATVTGEPDFALPYWDWTSLEMPEDFFNTTYNLQGLGLSAAQITDFQTTVHEASDTRTPRSGSRRCAKSTRASPSWLAATASDTMAPSARGSARDNTEEHRPYGVPLCRALRVRPARFS